MVELPVRAANIKQSSSVTPHSGGAERDRTDDLLLAKQALSQLSYSPNPLPNQKPLGSIGANGGPGKI
jgi:hypothetical protein